jgi:hypothetical protein
LDILSFSRYQNTLFQQPRYPYTHLLITFEIHIS